MSFVLSLSFVVGCLPPPGHHDTKGLRHLTPLDENALYQDLQARHPDHLNLALPYRGIIQSGRVSNLVRVVWMTESSPIGEGIIGTYDRFSRLRDVRLTRPIKYIRRIALNEEIDVLVIREVSATGTGLYEETMSILDVRNLSAPLWSGKVESWVEGVDRRNEGQLLRRVVAMVDFDYDGMKELLVVKLKQPATNLETIVSRKPQVQATVYSFDVEKHKFRRQKEVTPLVLYPVASDEEETF